MRFLLFLSSAAVTFVAMEYWARVLHHRLWHGPLWFVHRSHHQKRKGGWEWNDALSIFHAPVAAGLIIFGVSGTSIWAQLATGVGAGMTLFGAAYLLVHDGLVHGRLPVSALLRVSFFRRVRDAHLVHHRTARAPYGLFFAERELRTPAPSAQRSSTQGS